MNQVPPTRLLVGAEHVCGYLPQRRARSAFVDPALPMHTELYGHLLQQGFRRSGGYVYRPLCSGCNACQPVRIPVDRFRPDRAQRRCLRRNADLEFETAPRLGEEHFALYRHYLRVRHPDGGMDPDDAEAFHQFLDSPWTQTRFWTFRETGRLLLVAVVDRVPDGLSAVYTFFDPEDRARGLGTYAILRQIAAARAAGLPHLYLGYWVPGSPKMDYKRHFQPLEVLDSDGWRETGTRGS